MSGTGPGGRAVGGGRLAEKCSLLIAGIMAGWVMIPMAIDVQSHVCLWTGRSGL